MASPYKEVFAGGRWQYQRLPFQQEDEGFKVEFMTDTSHDDILKEDLDWYKKFHAMRVSGLCDSDCGKPATTWFGNTAAATCGDKDCVAEQQRVYDDH